MKRTRHTAEQIVSKLREADAMLAAGRPVSQIIQQLGVSEPTYARWRSQYGGMKADEARRLKELEIENTRLKKLVADQALGHATLPGHEPTARTGPGPGVRADGDDRGRVSRAAAEPSPSGLGLSRESAFPRSIPWPMCAT